MTGAKSVTGARRKHLTPANPIDAPPTSSYQMLRMANNFMRRTSCICCFSNQWSNLASNISEASWLALHTVTGHFIGSHIQGSIAPGLTTHADCRKATSKQRLVAASRCNPSNKCELWICLLDSGGRHRDAQRDTSVSIHEIFLIQHRRSSSITSGRRTSRRQCMNSIVGKLNRLLSQRSEKISSQRGMPRNNR